MRDAGQGVHLPCLPTRTALACSPYDAALIDLCAVMDIPSKFVRACGSHDDVT